MIPDAIPFRWLLVFLAGLVSVTGTIGVIAGCVWCASRLLHYITDEAAAIRAWFAFACLWGRGLRFDADARRWTFRGKRVEVDRG